MYINTKILKHFLGLFKLGRATIQDVQVALYRTEELITEHELKDIRHKILMFGEEFEGILYEYPESEASSRTAALIQDIESYIEMKKL